MLSPRMSPRVVLTLSSMIMQFLGLKMKMASRRSIRCVSLGYLKSNMISQYEWQFLMCQPCFYALFCSQLGIDFSFPSIETPITALFASVMIKSDIELRYPYMEKTFTSSFAIPITNLLPTFLLHQLEHNIVLL